MAKWADYLISQVLYDQNHIITKVKQHRDIGNKISDGEIVDRNVIADNLGRGAKYMTVYGDLGKIRIGKNVRYFQAYEHHYIRIDNNKVMSDNLGELPQLAESVQEEKPALSEVKPKPGIETKPLSALSSAFFSEQIEEEPAEVTPEPAEVTPEPAEVTPEPAEVTPEPAEVTPEPAEVTPEPAEVTPEPAEVTPEPAEVTPEVTKKKVVKMKSSTKKKPAKKKASKKKPAKKKASKKKASKKKPAKKKASKKKKRA